MESGYDMFDWLVEFGRWIVDIAQPLFTFFSSVVHGLSMLIKSFPMLLQLSGDAVSYVPSLFAVFISLTVIVLIVFQILGRNAGG